MFLCSFIPVTRAPWPGRSGGRSRNWPPAFLSSTWQRGIRRFHRGTQMRRPEVLCGNLRPLWINLQTLKKAASTSVSARHTEVDRHQVGRVARPESSRSVGLLIETRGRGAAGSGDPRRTELLRTVWSRAFHPTQQTTPFSGGATSFSRWK